MQNFAKAFLQLKNAVKRNSEDILVQAGIIQTFEFTFELAWKTMKDKLEHEGFNVKNPRETIKQAFQADYITEPSLWLDALDKRNLMAHTYEEDKAKEMVILIKEKYFPVIEDLYAYLQQELAKDL